jgi:hypothetical protein
VRKRGLEPLCLLGASTSSWCVCQFRHLRTVVNSTSIAKAGRAGEAVLRQLALMLQKPRKLMLLFCFDRLRAESAEGCFSARRIIPGLFLFDIWDATIQHGLN